MASSMVAVAQVTSPQQAPAPSTAAEKKFGAEQLDQMLAPIALYPDALLAQMLMAATYPLEVVEAARWVAANPNLKGDAAVKAVESKSWDVSVKSLVAFPQVLKQMNDQLEWTQSLGDAMLAQQPDVAASIQRLRKRAQDAGNLTSSDQQKVSTQAPPSGSTATQIIVIEPTNPQVIYVPVYQPTWAYGPWPYPAYPPYYYPPAPIYGYGAPLLRGFMWGVGIAAGRAFYSNWNWHGSGSIVIHNNRIVNIDRNYTQVGGGNWTHRPEHRKGVSYRDTATAARYGKGGAPGVDARQQFRGKDITKPIAGAGQGGQRPGQPAAGPISKTSVSHAPSGNQGGAFQGVDRSGQQVNREASRGQTSGSRSGGGRSGGGGGRR